MQRVLARVLLAVALVGALTLVPLTVSAPAVAGLDGPLYVVTKNQEMARNGESYATISLACPVGHTPVWGGYTDSRGDDIRRVAEQVNFGSGASYVVDLVNFSPAVVFGFTTVTVKVVCLAMVDITASKTVTQAFTVQEDHIAHGLVGCGAGFTALNSSVTFSGLETTVLTSSPFGGAWLARGWNQTIGASMIMSAHCIASADIDFARVYTHSDAVGWATAASAACPVGMSMLTGGTYHDGGDSGAITIDPDLVNRTLSSRTLSLSSDGSMVTTVMCVPTSRPVVSLSGGPTPTPTSTTARWDFTATDPAAAGNYGVSTTCMLRNVTGSPVVIYQGQPCSSPVQQPGLAQGTYELTVSAVTGDGRTDVAWWHVSIDHTPPVVVFADAPGKPHASTGGQVVGTVTDAFTFVTGLTCAVDAATPAPCGSSQSGTFPGEPPCTSSCAYYQGQQVFPLPVVADGTHTLHVRATDVRGSAKTFDLPYVLDTVAPTVTQTGPTARFTIGTTTKASWTGRDATSGIASYRVRWQRAPYNAGFGAWSAPVTTTATSRSFDSLRRGNTYCYAADALDKAGHTSAWASARCTAIPLDDRDLAASGGWTAGSPSGWFRGTSSRATRSGASLSVTGATLKRTALVARMCPTCGTVGVFVAGTRVATVSLADDRNVRRRVVLPDFSLRSGTVTLKVLSSGKLVEVDALGLSRR